MEKLRKPPIGIKPRYLHDEQRLKDLQGAIKRYAKKFFQINPEWITEYNQLIAKLQK
jgi:hypothetical protein